MCDPLMELVLGMVIPGVLGPSIFISVVHHGATSGHIVATRALSYAVRTFVSAKEHHKGAPFGQPEDGFLKGTR